MKKYIQIAKGLIQETFIYRLNFTMWRVRNVLVFLSTYFVWMALLPPGRILFNYNNAQILTYIFTAEIIGNIVFSTRTTIVADEINSGDLSNSLLKPINYFWRIFAIDIGDKIMNISFSAVEITILIFILRPPLFLQTNPILLLATFAAIILSLATTFFINLLLGTIGFWSNETWAPRFIFSILFQFLSGLSFPLDIFPKPFLTFIQSTPFPYLLYFPVKLYLGQVSTQQIISGLAISAVWMVLSYGLLKWFWAVGLKGYSAQGR